MKYLITLLVLLTANICFSNLGYKITSESRQLCKIQVRLETVELPLKLDDNWPGLYKLGFEAYGSMNLEMIIPGRTYEFNIPCFQNYIKLQFNYATLPITDDLKLIIQHEDYKIVLNFSTESCREARRQDKHMCAGFDEKFINNITLR